MPEPGINRRGLEKLDAIEAVRTREFKRGFARQAAVPDRVVIESDPWGHFPVLNGRWQGGSQGDTVELVSSCLQSALQGKPGAGDVEAPVFAAAVGRKPESRHAL